jgi:hypothetical protein
MVGWTTVDQSRVPARASDDLREIAAAAQLDLGCRGNSRDRISLGVIASTKVQI